MAEDRKARLKALAAKAGRTKEVPVEDEPVAEKKAITFRNYAPTDKSLVATVGDDENSNEEPQSKKAKVDDDRKPAAAAPPTSKSMLQDALAETKQQSVAPAAIAKEVVTTMAPKKINWDLKRDIQPKLDKLERRTQKVIVEMLKERLELEATQAMDDEDDDDDNLD